LSSAAIAALFAFAAQESTEAEEALKTFRSAYRAATPAARAAAVTELARTKDPKVVDKLGTLLGADEAQVRIAAAGGLAEASEPRARAVRFLVEALAANSRLPEVQVALFESLGKLGEESALPTVHRAFREKDVRVAKAAIRAAGTIRGKSSMEPLVALMKNLDKCIKTGQSGGYRAPKGAGEQGPPLEELLQETIRAIQTLTGESWTTVQEWEIWWNRRKASFDVKKDRPGP